MKTALIAAEGYGTRFFGYKNPSGKGFIDLNGKSLFSYVVSGLKKYGIEKIVIAANKNNWKRYLAFEHMIDTEIFIGKELKGVIYLTYALESKLPEQYFLLYCHQPITSSHLNTQSQKNRKKSIGVSIYSEYEEKKRIPVVINDDGTVKFLRDDERSIEGYIGAPYIVIGSEMARLGKSDDFKHWSGYYIKKASKEGIPIIGTIADMPPEIDFPNQFPKLAKTLISDKFRFHSLSCS